MLKKLLLLLSIFVFSYGEYIEPTEAFKISSNIQNDNIIFDFQINENVYIYKKDLSFSINGSKNLVEFVNLPEAILKDEYKIYRDELEISLPLGLVMGYSSLDKFEIVTGFGGCANDGFCYPPQFYKFEFSKSLNGYEIQKIKLKNLPRQSSSNLAQSSSNSQEIIAKNISSKSIWIVILTFFGYGILLSFTPCVLPMIPILSSIIVSKSNTPKNSAFLISLIYVLGMALTYALTGVGAALLGASLQAILQIPIVIALFSLIFVFLAFSMFGFYSISVPAVFQNRLKNSTKSGYIGVFVMGILSALIVGPCIAPPLAGALLYIAQSNDIISGALALFAMGLGMGVLLLMVGAGFKKFVPKPGFWMNEINKFFGFVLLYIAVWMISRVISPNLTLLIYALLLFVFASSFGLFESVKGEYDRVKKGILAFIFVYAILLMLGFASGSKSVLKPLVNLNLGFNTAQTLNPQFKYISNLKELDKFVKSSQKPVMIDFWATWCVECKKLDGVIESSEVAKELARFELVKVDVSKNLPDDKELMSRFNIYGPPALVFFKDTKELKNLQITGAINRDELLQILSQI